MTKVESCKGPVLNKDERSRWVELGNTWPRTKNQASEFKALTDKMKKGDCRLPHCKWCSGR